jgi:DNA polymerase-4
VIPTERVEEFLQRLPVDSLWGVGPVTARKLRASGIVRLIDVRTVDLKQLRAIVGSQAESLVQLAHGLDDRPVVPDRPSKSAGSENTYAQDLTDLQTIRSEIDRMARQAAAWLERRLRVTRTVTIKVRYSDFTTITRNLTEPPPTRDAGILAARAVSLLERTEAGVRPVRLLGVSVHNLEPTDPGRSAVTGVAWPRFWDQENT